MILSSPGTKHAHGTHTLHVDKIFRPLTLNLKIHKK